MKRVAEAGLQLVRLIDRWHWLVLMAAAPFLLFPGADLRALAILVVPGLWLAAWIARREPVPVTPLNPALALLATMLVVSALVTPDLGFSLGKLAGVILGLGTYFAVVRISQSERGWWVCLIMFLAAGSAVAVAGLLVTDWLQKVALLTPVTAQLSPRILGIPGIEEGLNPNQLAGALTWIVPPFLVLLTASLIGRTEIARRIGRPVTWALLGALAGTSALVFSTFVLTQSRSGYLGVAATGALAPLFFTTDHRHRRYAGLLVSIGGCATVLFAFWALGALSPLAGQAPGLRAVLSPPLSMQMRLELWSKGLAIIRDFPFTGIGLNNVRLVVPEIYTPLLTFPGVLVGHVHNEYLQAAVDLGLPGLVAFLALELGALQMAGRVWRADSAPGMSTPNSHPVHLRGIVVLGLAGGLLAHMVFGLADATALGAKPGVLFWLLLGLLAGAHAQVAGLPGPAAPNLLPHDRGQSDVDDGVPNRQPESLPKAVG